MTRSLFSFFGLVLSLPASLTLTANTFLLPVRGGVNLRPHRVGTSPNDWGLYQAAKEKRHKAE